MKDPWEEIELSDYENHMKSDSQEDELIILMKDMNYCLIDKIEKLLPNGKKLVQLDFELHSLG